MRRYSLVWIVILVLGTAGCDEILYHGLSEQQANEIIVALAGRGIDASKIQDGSLWNVVTDSEFLERALVVLRRYRLPRNELVNDTENSTSLLPGREEREYRRERQISRSLESTLMAFPGIVEARVHLSLSKRPVLNSDTGSQIASASVLLVHRTGATIDLGAIRSIVAGASGVAPSQVVVVNLDSADDREEQMERDFTNDGGPIAHDIAFQFPTRSVQKSKFIIAALCCFAISTIGLSWLRLRLRRRRVTVEPEPSSDHPEQNTEPDGDSLRTDSIFEEFFVQDGKIIRREELLQ